MRNRSAPTAKSTTESPSNARLRARRLEEALGHDHILLNSDFRKLPGSFDALLENKRVRLGIDDRELGDVLDKAGMSGTPGKRERHGNAKCSEGSSKHVDYSWVGPSMATGLHFDLPSYAGRIKAMML